jgi:hypothetical protein
VRGTCGIAGGAKCPETAGILADWPARIDWTAVRSSAQRCAQYSSCTRMRQSTRDLGRLHCTLVASLAVLHRSHHKTQQAGPQQRANPLSVKVTLIYVACSSSCCRCAQSTSWCPSLPWLQTSRALPRFQIRFCTFWGQFCIQVARRSLLTRLCGTAAHSWTTAELQGAPESRQQARGAAGRF